MDDKPGIPANPAISGLAGSATGAAATTALPTGGQVMVHASWSTARRCLTALDVAAQRPVAARLLVGKTPAEVLRLVPLLYSLCGGAQTAVAEAALAAAAGAAEIRQDGAAVRREVIQEHLWRLWLDWPDNMSHGDFLRSQKKPDRAAFALWHRRLRAPAGLDADGRAELLEVVEGRLGEAVESWAQELDAAVVARSGAALAAPDFLPALSLELLSDVFAGTDADFARNPVYQGRPAETGALARQWGGDASLAGRLRARWRDLRATVAACAEPAPPVLGLAVGAASGVAGVDTARGLLVHGVRLLDGRVADYRVIAPTEWNFHPQQRWQEQLCGEAAETPEIAENLLRRWVLALDPCVPIRLTIDKED